METTENTSTPAEPLQEPAAAAPPPAATADDTPTADADKLAQQVEHWKSMARKQEARAKENAAAAARLTEIEDAQKSEAEKLQARLEAAEKRAADAEQARLRAEIAQSKGVPAELLAGATEEELLAAADKLLEFRGQQASTPAADYGRTTDASPTKPRQLTKADMANMSSAQINEAYEAGLLEDVMAGRSR